MSMSLSTRVFEVWAGVSPVKSSWRSRSAQRVGRLTESSGDIQLPRSVERPCSTGGEDAVQAAVIATLGVPERDRFQTITAHDPDDLIFDRSYLDIERSDRFVCIQVTLSAGRTQEAKQAFYARLAELLGEKVSLRSEDLAVILVENNRDDWSFGRGEASYVVLPRAERR
jgi:4-oxalocrotonate tautomerase